MKLSDQLPSHWSSARLGEVAKVQAGGTPDRQNMAFWGGQIPWVGTGGINFNWIESASEYITESGLSSSSAKLLPAGSLLMAMIGQGATRGKVATLRIAAATNQNCAGIVPSSKIDSRFLFHFLASCYSTIRASGNSGGVSNMNTSMVRDIEVPVPAAPEGKRIGEILDTWDRAVELTGKLIATKQQRKTALMQQLLTGKVRLPEFGSKSWQTAPLGDHFTERRQSGYLDLPLLSITATEGIVHRDTLEKKDSSNADKSAYLRICPGDIGYNTMRMWQGVSAISAYEGIVSPAYTVCTPKPSIHATFAGYLFKLPAMIHIFWRHSQGLVDDTLNLKFASFRKIKVTLPTAVEEQKAIAAVLNAQDHELALHRRKLDALRRQKKGLMQQLLTGKIRVQR